MPLFPLWQYKCVKLTSCIDSAWPKEKIWSASPSAMSVKFCLCVFGITPQCSHTCEMKLRESSVPTGTHLMSGLYSMSTFFSGWALFMGICKWVIFTGPSLVVIHRSQICVEVHWACNYFYWYLNNSVYSIDFPYLILFWCLILRTLLCSTTI